MEAALEPVATAEDCNAILAIAERKMAGVSAASPARDRSAGREEEPR